jgi:hypothetical protein
VSYKAINTGIAPAINNYDFIQLRCYVENYRFFKAGLDRRVIFQQHSSLGQAALLESMPKKAHQK